MQQPAAVEQQSQRQMELLRRVQEQPVAGGYRRWHQRKRMRQAVPEEEEGRERTC